jgi:dihydrofolate reductase
MGDAYRTVHAVGTVQYYCAATLDGYIADSEDGIEWLTGYEGTYEGEDAEPSPMSDGGSYEAFYDGVGALVSGSTTYEFVLDHVGEGGTLPYAGKPYWVLSSRELPTPEGDEVRIVNAGVNELFDELMASAGDRNLWVMGGGNVASQFADEGLLDELILTVVPVVLGEGKPLFERPLPRPIRLVGTRAFESGMVELRYLIWS